MCSTSKGLFHSRSRRLLRLFAVMLVMPMLLLQALPQGASAQDGPARSSEEQALLSKAQIQGRLPIIVGLNTSFAPEGDLASPAAQQQRDGISRAQDALLARLANQDVRGVRRFQTVPFVAMNVSQATLRVLLGDGSVKVIQEDELAAPILAQSVPLIGGNATGTFGISNYSGLGKVVAILDTGVQKTHTFLTGKVLSEACYSDAGGGGSGTTVCPGNVNASIAVGSGVNCLTTVSGCDHGTHVAGIAAGKGATFSGVAKEAKIIAVQVFTRFNSAADCSGSAPCVLSYTSDQMLGLERVYALRNTYSISSINMSIGGGQHTSSCDTDARKAIIDNLLSAGIATVIAAGNDGRTNAVSAPGCISTAITVGSTTKTDVISGFSNMDDQVDLMAPGSSINSSVASSSSNSAFGVKSGTSMATPHVTGAWAVMKQKKPTASVSEILAALNMTGKPILDTRAGGTQTRDRIQLNTAVDYLNTPASCVDSYETTGDGNNAAAFADTLLVNGASQLHRFCQTIDQDWVKFTVAANVSYRISTYGLSVYNDTILDVYRNAGTTLLRTNDDDDNGSYGSTVIFTPSAAGTYYARVRPGVGAGGSSSYTYYLRITSFSNPCNFYEADNTPATATFFGVGTTQSRALCAAADKDFVRFKVKAGQTLRLETLDLGVGATPADTVLQLLSTNGTTQLAINDDLHSPNRRSQVTYTFTTAGYYYAMVRGYSNGGGPGQTYNLRIERVDIPPVAAASTLSESTPKSDE